MVRFAAAGFAGNRPAHPNSYEFRYACKASLEMKPVSARNAAAKSPGATYSAGLWLTPPRHRTKSIAIGAIFEI
jgi:hypothetical protein